MVFGRTIGTLVCGEGEHVTDMRHRVYVRRVERSEERAQGLARLCQRFVLSPVFRQE
jgi:hypothetical protein